jgi:hypothetical protein
LVDKYNTSQLQQKRHIAVKDKKIVISHKEIVKAEIMMEEIVGVSRTTLGDDDLTIHFKQTHNLDIPFHLIDMKAYDQALFSAGHQLVVIYFSNSSETDLLGLREEFP